MAWGEVARSFDLKGHALKSAVLFDLDETLFNRSASVRSFVEQQFSNKDWGSFAGLEALCDRFMELDSRGSVPTVYRVVTEEIGLPGNDNGLALFNDYATNAWRYAFAFEGMHDLLLWLREDSHKTGIVSNGQAHI